MKEGVKFPEINSRKNSSITSTQQQFAAMIQLQQQQAQVYQNSSMNTKASVASDQKEQINTSSNIAVDPKYDQSQVYQWEENYKKRQQNIHNINYIKNYNDAEPERPKQLYAQRTQVEGRITGEMQNQHKGDGSYQSTLEARNGQRLEQNNQNQSNQGQSLKNQNSLQNIQDNYRLENNDDSDQENFHSSSSKITHSNIQINYKTVKQPHPLQTINKNQDDKQKILLVPKENYKQSYTEKDSRQLRQNNGIQQDYLILNAQRENIYQNANNHNQSYQNDQENEEDLENEDDNQEEDNPQDDDEEEGEEEDDDLQDEDDDQDAEDDEEEEEEEGEYPFLVLKDVINMKRNIKLQKRIIIDLAFTRYDVIKDVCEDVFKWQIQANANNRTDYNIQWIDSYVHEDDFRRMLPFQKINHFPGSQQLGKKNLLGQNLQKMRNLFPQNYNFYPITWVLPLQYEDLRMYHYQNIKRKPYYIVKPEASCQGRGIYLTSRIDQLQNADHHIVQEYIKNPFLIDNLKFDLRLYVLIKSISPLKVFLFQEGLARFATVPYKSPNKNNVQNLMMHLTNYALNKKSPDFVQNEDSEDDDIGHKRSFSSVLKYLYNQGHDVETLMMEIRQIIVKTIISAQPQMSHMYRTCQPKSEQNEMCFEVLGFDIMLDEDLKPYLIEVNHTPSFWTDSPLDLQVKKNLIIDTLNIINVTNKTKKKYYEMRVQQQIASRSLFRKKYGPALNTGQEEFDEELLQQEYYEWEEENMGSYIRIFPANDDPLNYSQFLQASGGTLSDQISRKKRFYSNQEIGSNINIFTNQQHQQIQQQLNGMIGMNNNFNNYPHHQQSIGSSRNQLDQQQQIYNEQNYQMLINESSPQKPLKIKLVHQQQRSIGYTNINNIPTESSNFTPIHVQMPQQLPGNSFQQQQQNIYLQNGNYPNNQYKNLHALPSGPNLTPGKLRQSVKGNTINAATNQQNGISSYQVTGSSYISSSAKKQFNPKLGDTQPQQNNQQQLQQQQQFIFLDEIEGISNFTYAEPTKPLIMNMESPQQIIRNKKNENGATIFQQKSLILNQQPKNVNTVKLQPVEQQRSNNSNNNSLVQGTLRKENQEPKKNRIASSQSFHQSSANPTLSSTNQSNSNNHNNSMSIVQNEKTVELEKNKKSLNNTSIIDNSLVSQTNSSGKASQIAPGLKDQNSNSSFKKDLAQTNSSKDDELDEYQYKKSLKNMQHMQHSSRVHQHKGVQDNKNLNNSFNGNNNSQSGQHHQRAISLVTEKNASQIQKVLKEDMYPHNINQNLKRLNSSLQHQNGDQQQNSSAIQGKIEDNIYFPFGSPQTQNNKIRNKSAVNPVMVAAYSHHNNQSYIKSNQNTHSHNAANASPIILPNVMISNSNNNNINNVRRQESINNVIIPKQIEDHERKILKSKAKHE